MKLFKSLTEIKTHTVHDEYMALNQEDGKVYLNSKYVGDMEVKK